MAMSLHSMLSSKCEIGVLAIGGRLPALGGALRFSTVCFPKPLRVVHNADIGMDAGNLGPLTSYKKHNPISTKVYIQSRSFSLKDHLDVTEHEVCLPLSALRLLRLLPSSRCFLSPAPSRSMSSLPGRIKISRRLSLWPVRDAS